MGISNNSDDSEIVVDVLNKDGAKYFDSQTTEHIIEVVRQTVISNDVSGNVISVDIVNDGSLPSSGGGGTGLDTDAIAAIVRLVYVANEVPTGLVNGSNSLFRTASNYKPQSTRLFINGLRQSTPANYVEAGGNELLLSFIPAHDDVLLVDYIKL